MQFIQYSKPKLLIDSLNSTETIRIPLFECVNHQIGVMNSCNGYLALYLVVPSGLFLQLEGFGGFYQLF